MRITLLFVLLLGYFGAGATHIQGGYIRVTPVAGQALTYTITALIYTEPTSSASRDMNSIPICLGDGTSRIVNQKSQSVIGTGGRLAASVYETTYTYAGAGTYRITVSLANRSVLLNGPADADQSLLTVATTFTISNTGSNNTPLPVAPETNFVVTVNQRATLSLRATDPEGDSLVYRLATPMTAANATPCSGSTLSRYTYPNDVARQGTFTLNGRTGELIWFAPVREGRYNVAIYIDEYRNGINISQTLEEITLVAEDRPGNTPVTLPAYEPAVTSGIITALSEQRDASVQLSVFPNPVEENLQVVVQSNAPGLVVVQLFDTSGRQIHQLGSGKAVRRHEQVIGMGSLSAGTYLIRADVAGRVLTEKIVKK